MALLDTTVRADELATRTEVGLGLAWLTQEDSVWAVLFMSMQPLLQDPKLTANVWLARSDLQGRQAIEEG